MSGTFQGAGSLSHQVTSLELWTERFSFVDFCPWPGPAPLTEKQGHLLVGRSDDLLRFRSLLKEENKRLILLHAPSGVGKSSLLEAGIKRELQLQGSDVKTVNKWGGFREGEKASEFLAHKLQLSGSKPFDRFAELGASGVLILDQFEELVRYSPAVTRELFDEILQINSLFKTKVIVSFRSEYLHDFETREWRRQLLSRSAVDRGD